jgi:hypothetical protein
VVGVLTATKPRFNYFLDGRHYGVLCCLVCWVSLCRGVGIVVLL